MIQKLKYKLPGFFKIFSNKRSAVVTGFLFISFLAMLSFGKQEEFDLKASIERGKNVYIVYCLSCHMENGEGIEGLYPPVANSDYMIADSVRAVQQIIYGVTGEIMVNGKKYNTKMEKIDLNDEQVSDVMNYMRNSWGGKARPIKPEDVKAMRKK